MMSFIKMISGIALIFGAFIALFYVVGHAGKAVTKASNVAVISGLFVFCFLTAAIVVAFWKGLDKMLESKGVQKRLKDWGIMLALLVLTGCSCSVIEPGHVGIVVDNWGDDKGVQNYTAKTGFVMRVWPVYSILEYQTNTQTTVWKETEALNFNSKEGAVFKADISLSYRIMPDKVPAFYVKFRSDDLRSFTHGYLRNVARTALNDVAALYTTEQVYSDKKEVILVEAMKLINRQVEPDGVVLEQFGFYSAPEPPAVIVTAINAKTQAIQDAIKVENQVRQARAEAEKNVATAEGSARSKIAVAKGEAEANRLLTASITPSLIEWRRLEITKDAVARWNGQRPQVEGTGSGLLLQIQPK